MIKMKKLRKNGRQLSILVIGMLLFLLCNPEVSALGVSPAGKTLEYLPGSAHDLTFSLFVSEGERAELVLSVEGPLKDNVRISDERVILSGLGGAVTFSAKVLLPAGLDPGTSTTYIVVSEDQSAPGPEKETTVASVSKLLIPIRVLVPNEGKHASATLSQTSTNPSTPIGLQVQVLNTGTIAINKAYADIKIFDAATLKATISTNEKNIPVQGSEKLSATWKSDGKKGEYAAEGVLYYDGLTKPLNTAIFVGTWDLLFDAAFEPQGRGVPSKLTMRMQNDWNSENEAYFEGAITNSAGGKVLEFTSGTIRVESYGSAELDQFIDSAGLPEGEYSASITAIHSGGKTNAIFTIFMTEEGLTSIIPEQDAAGLKDSEKKTNVLLWVIILVLLVVVGVILVILLGKHKKRRVRRR